MIITSFQLYDLLPRLIACLANLSKPKICDLDLTLICFDVFSLNS